MMKFQALIFCFIFAAGTSFAQNRSINFETSTFSDIKAKAKKENKLIFVDAYAEWCGPCKWMAANIFTNDTVADYFNDKFISAQIDMEKGEGPGISIYYEVHCYPNLLFIDGDGNLVHRSAGAMDTKHFIALAEDALNPEKRFSKLKSEYETRKSDPKFVYEYLNVISRTCLPFEDIVSDYFNSMNDEELSGRTSWNILRDYTSDFRSRQFIYLINNEDKFKEKYSGDSVDAVIKNALMSSGLNIIFNPDMKESDYISFKNEITNLKSSVINEVLFQLDLNYFYKDENWKKFIDLAIEKGDNYFKDLSDFNKISWTIYEHSDDTVSLQKAAGWMQKTLEDVNNQEWYAYDTYAAVLFKLNKKGDAKAAGLKAVELAKAGNLGEDEYKSTIELLEEIDKLK
jgi:thioredoxin-related protein